jgi:hypothetical protein
MPLVIFFVPDPARGVAEMVRVVKRGGMVTAYAWDIDGGFPYRTLQEEARALGATVPMPPRPDASRIDVMQDLWRGAGLDMVATRVMTVRRTFADFEDYWSTVLGGPSVRATLASMTAGQIADLSARMHARLSADPAGRISYTATANAVKGLRKG